MAAYGTDSMGGSGQGSGNNQYQYGQSVEERMRDIQEREQRVLDMERELDEKEQRLQKQYKGYRPSKNWPGARCAIARHDISKDIASRYQNHVRKFYSLWWLVVLACCLNWLSVIWYGLFKKETNFMSYVLLPTLYVCVGCPCTWMFWYKRYYRAMQNNGNLSYMFFVFFGLQILWSGVNTIGFENIGSCGVLVTLKQLAADDNVALLLLMCITTVIWGLSCVVGVYLLKLAHFDLGTYLARKYAPMARSERGSKADLQGSLNAL